MILAHRIALDPTVKQRRHFAKAAGVARFAYNWALAEWRRQYEAGEKPSANKLKAQWNAVRRESFQWSLDVTKCAGSQAIMNLGAAFTRFFADLKKTGRRSGFPKFKKRGRCHDSFAVWNDQFVLDVKTIRLPIVGYVRMRERLRLDGKVMGAVVSRTADRWFVSISVEMPDVEVKHEAAGSVVGVDLGIKTLASLSRPLPDGRQGIENPKAARRLSRRISKLQRRLARQEEARKRSASKKTSRRHAARKRKLARLHARIANVRRDAIHKATTAISKAFDTVVLEDLNVTGMSKNHALAGSIADAAFGEFRRQIDYKTKLRGGRVVVADRFYPSSKTCSHCRHVLEVLPLGARSWRCPICNVKHDRDRNAAVNLELVGRATPEPAITSVTANARGHRSSDETSRSRETTVMEPRTRKACHAGTS